MDFMSSITEQLKYGVLVCCSCTIIASLATPVSADYAYPAEDKSSEIDMGATAVLEPANTLSMWTNEQGLTSDGYDLLAQIEKSKNEGLDPERYQLSAINELTAESWHPAAREPLDQLMTTAFEQLIIDLGQGLLTPRDAQRRWFQTPQTIDPELAYLSLQIPGSTIGSVIEQHRPLMANYRTLSNALVQYGEIEDAGGWPHIKKGKTIKMGMADPRIQQIETRLNLTSDLPPEALSSAEYGSSTFSQALFKAVKKFQHRHGLQDDGIIGNQTIAAMNTPVTKKIETIKINLERLRWLPRDLGERHIITNIAEYKLRVMERNQVLMSMPVVVGKKKFKTPVFSDELEYLVVNPTWTVPKSILYSELLPEERLEPGYLASRNYELIREVNGQIVVRDPNSIAHSDYQSANFPYTVRQKPGGKNALGKIKFIFPNKYSVYLHDTPSKSLFSSNTRAFSHGCIRVGNPKALAEMLLGFEGWDKERFEAAYNKKKQAYINLAKPIKNHITYQTSWVDDENQVNFRPDIYGHDTDLAKAMQNPRVIAWPKTILAELRE